MNRSYTVLFVFLAFLWCIAPCQAEVHLEENRLTVNVQEITIEEVFQELSQQGDINVVALEETNFGNVKISKRFWNLPLEEGLDRLLSGWNYGLHRNQSTGKIVTLYLVSRQSQPPELAKTVSSSSIQPQNRILDELHNQPSLPRATQNIALLDYDDDDDDEDTGDEYEDFGEDVEPSRKSVEISPSTYLEYIKKSRGPSQTLDP